MGLEVETVEEGKRRKPVADYVREHDGDWDEWLQTHRVELNAMTTPQFIAWLDRKMAEHGNGKLIPPGAVLETELAERIEKKVRAAHTERILREAGFERQVADTIAAIKKPSSAVLAKGEDLQRLVRQPEKVLKSAAKQRSSELIADFENQMGQEYRFDQDEIWAQAMKAAEREVQKAQAQVAARCRELGIPDQFAPSLSLDW